MDDIVQLQKIFILLQKGLEIPRRVGVLEGPTV